MPNTVRTIVILVATLVWALNYGVAAFTEYIPPPEVHLVFVGIVTALVAGYKREDDGPPKDPKPNPDDV